MPDDHGDHAHESDPDHCVLCCEKWHAEALEAAAERAANAILGTEHQVRIKGAKNLEEAMPAMLQQVGLMMREACAAAVRRGPDA